MVRIPCPKCKSKDVSIVESNFHSRNFYKICFKCHNTWLVKNPKRQTKEDSEKACRGEVEAFCVLAATADAQEGVSALLDKREPTFRGR